MSEEEDYSSEVDKLLDKRSRNGVVQYKVLWLGYSVDDEDGSFLSHHRISWHSKDELLFEGYAPEVAKYDREEKRVLDAVKKKLKASKDDASNSSLTAFTTSATTTTGGSQGGPVLQPSEQQDTTTGDPWDLEDTISGASSSTGGLSRPAAATGNAKFSTNIVVLRNIPKEAKLDDVKHYAEPYGKIKKVDRLGANHATVEFKYDFDAKAMVEHKDFIMFKQPVRAQFFKEKRTVPGGEKKEDKPSPANPAPKSASMPAAAEAPDRPLGSYLSKAHKGQQKHENDDLLALLRQSQQQEARSLYLYSFVFGNNTDVFPTSTAQEFCVKFHRAQADQCALAQSTTKKPGLVMAKIVEKVLQNHQTHSRDLIVSEQHCEFQCFAVIGEAINSHLALVQSEKAERCAIFLKMEIHKRILSLSAFHFLYAQTLLLKHTNHLNILSKEVVAYKDTLFPQTCTRSFVEMREEAKGHFLRTVMRKNASLEERIRQLEATLERERAERMTETSSMGEATLSDIGDTEDLTSGTL